MDKTKQPGINFDNVILGKLNFIRKISIPVKPELKLNINNKKSINSEAGKLVYELTGKIEDEKEKSFSVECSVIGFFSVDKEKSNMSLEDFANANAPAILFPYFRNAVADVTMRGGLKPVIIPPLNIASMVKKDEEKQQ